VLTKTSKIDIKVQRDREGNFDPELIARDLAPSNALVLNWSSRRGD